MLSLGGRSLKVAGGLLILLVIVITKQTSTTIDNAYIIFKYNLCTVICVVAFVKFANLHRRIVTSIKVILNMFTTLSNC